jgi:DNA invertase Pin-like site-specific DNA recombinase
VEKQAVSPAPLAYSYTRVSSGQQAAGGGLDRQEAMAQEWCARHGYQLDTALDLSDAGRSAYRGDHIKKGALGRFLEQAQARRLGLDPVLLIEAVDRLSRQEPLEALKDTFLALVQAGVAVVDLEDGQAYSRNTLNTDPLALVKLALKVQAAHDYSRRLSRRVSAHWDQARDRAKKGQVMRGRGGTLPFWLKPNASGGWQLIEDRAEVVRLIFRLAQGQGAATIAQELNRRGLPGPAGGRWRDTSVSLVLKSPAAWGARALNHRALEKAKARRKRWEENKAGPQPPLPEIETVEGYFPPVISREEFDQVARAVERRQADTAARARADGAMRTWLQGLVFCQGGSLMTACTHQAKGFTVAVLRCRAHRKGAGCTCGRSGWKAHHVEAHAMQRLPRLMQLLAQHQAAGQGEEVQALEQIVKAAECALTDARRALEKAEQSRDKAVDQSKEVVLLEQLALLVERRQGDVRATEQRLAHAQGALDDHHRRRGMAAELAGDEATQLMRALVNGEGTASERRQYNALLKRVGFSLVLDDANPEMKMVRVRLGQVGFRALAFLGADEVHQARFMFPEAYLHLAPAPGGGWTLAN